MFSCTTLQRANGNNNPAPHARNSLREYEINRSPYINISMIITNKNTLYENQICYINLVSKNAYHKIRTANINFRLINSY